MNRIAEIGAWGLLACASALSPPAPAQDFAIYGQATNVTQWHPPFHSPYSGDNSLDAHGRAEETTDLTAYAGIRPWRGGEIWINPEIDQGFGLSNTVGVAGFPSGEAYKVGNNTPYLRLPRAFLRQLIALGGGEEDVEAAANQLAGKRASNNLTLTIGKFSAVDIFDANTYAHDPRSDFMNLSRAGVAENSSRTSTQVPGLSAAGRRGALAPRSTMISCPLLASRILAVPWLSPVAR